MCGLFAFVSEKGAKTSEFIAMAKPIAHRGPDGEGFVLFDKGNQFICAGDLTDPTFYTVQSDYAPRQSVHELSDKAIQVGLGHKRLSIIDLTFGGHQPMCIQNGRYWIVFNGEIYNYLELRDELTQLGCHFVSQSDTEVILHAYSQWGQHCQHRFRGMWAFVIYDTQKQTLFASRDRFGIKPLYYWNNGQGACYFASEIKQFTVLPGWKAKANGAKMAQFAAYSVTDADTETLFEGVMSVGPGQSLEQSISDLSRNNPRPQTWYNLSPEPFKGSFEEATDRFRDIFERAITLHLRSDVKVGSALSGGLDSSSIVCEVNHQLRLQGKVDIQNTFSSCAVDSQYDERKWMDIVINHTNIDSHYVYPYLDNFENITRKVLWHQDEPYQSQSTFLGYHVFELAKNNGVKVLLNGQGADEYLGGYYQFSPPYLAQLLSQLKLGKFMEEYRHTMASQNISHSALMRVILFNFSPVSIRRFFSTRNNRAYESLIDLEKLGQTAFPHPFESAGNAYSSVDDIRQFNLFHNPLQRYLKWEDRNSMAHSIEARVPFLDHELVEFASGCPTEYLIGKGWSKRILRESMRHQLPQEIAYRRDKQGFITPAERWLRIDQPELFINMMETAIERSNQTIKPEALNYVKKMAQSEIPFDFAYWRLIMLGYWMDIFDVTV